MSSYSLKPAQCLAKDSWAPTQDHSLPTATNGWLLPAMDCRQEATSGRQAGNRKKIQMERLAKENYYPGHFGNFGSGQKARLSSSSGSSVVSRAEPDDLVAMIRQIPQTRYWAAADQIPGNIRNWEHMAENTMTRKMQLTNIYQQAAYNIYYWNAVLAAIWNHILYPWIKES